MQIFKLISLSPQRRRNPTIRDNLWDFEEDETDWAVGNSYNTRSNKVRVVKTPGGKLQYQHLKKRGSPPKCGDCGIKLPGIPALRPRQYATISRPKKTVQRAYGGSRCSNCVKDRVVRAFLIEEQKIVKKVLKESQQKKR
ncbi:MAG: hypothetical protein Q9218_006295 [Villophora microphyllina]